VRQGISNLVDHYIDVHSGDGVFILYTLDARDPAAWIYAEFAARGFEPKVIRMKALQDETLGKRLHETLPDPATLKSRIVLLTLERDTMSHSRQLHRALAPYPQQAWTMLRLISASADLFKYALNVTPRTLSGVNGALLTRMMPAKVIHVSSSSGTRLDIELDSKRYRWLSNRGLRREGAFLILPPGEVSTFPANINGVLVADGAFNYAVSTSIDARLADHPVTIEIRYGRVVSYSCRDSSVRRLLGRFFDAKNTDRVGELGFGTNIGIQRFVPLNSHINERHPGVHLGLGAHQQRFDAVPYRCDIHLDLITSDATIVVEDDEVIQSSDLAHFRSEHHPDPLREGIGDEDLDGDCCGAIAAEAAKARGEYLRLIDRR
jgi:leucyl aminopeptidase (aminopeptidase T)